MQVLVFGRLLVMQRTVDLLREEGISVISISDGFAEIIDLLETDRFNLAIIDSHAEEAKVAYYRINEFGAIPVVFIVSDRKADWNRIQSLDAFGYLPEHTGDRELAARLKTILRRRLTQKKTDKSNSGYAA